MVSKKPTIDTQIKLQPRQSSTTLSKSLHTVTNKSQPLRATYVPPKKPPKISDKNVMNTVHNVTVASPPSVRRELPSTYDDTFDLVEPLDRRRTRTRTLEPDEIIILKHRANDKETTSTPATMAVEIKEPVAFEIKFEEEKPKSTITKKTTGATVNDDDYDDDFESYESDFESGSSTASSVPSTATDESLPASQSHSKSTSTESLHHKDQNEIAATNLRKSQEDERQLDSGAFELKAQVERSQMDSIDERQSQSDEQNDSGIGYNSASVTPKPITTSVGVESYRLQQPNAIHRNPAATTNKRGLELMQKITLDTMTYSIFEMKPIPYEYYMRVYGHVNSTQMATQTNEMHSDQDAQTDVRLMQNVWTQWPPKFSSKDTVSLSFHQDRLGYGIEDEDGCYAAKQNRSLYDESLHQMARLKSNRALAATVLRPGTVIDYNRLSLFLQKCAITVSGLLPDHNQRHREEHRRSWVSCADGYFALDSAAMPTVRMLYANAMGKNFLYTVHEEQPSPTDDTPKICVFVWNLLAPAKPVYRLAGWGRICCLEISSNVCDIVVAGLDDGSLAVWHMSELAMVDRLTHDDDTPTFIPSQVIMPGTEMEIVDYGRVVAIKSMNVVYGMANAMEQSQVCKSSYSCGYVVLMMPISDYVAARFWPVDHLDGHSQSNGQLLE